MMQIKVDKDSLIIAYASIGQLEDGIEFDVPSDFIKNFRSKYYMLQNGTVIVNPDYTEASKLDVESSDPTAEQISLTTLAEGYSENLAHIKSLEESVTELAKNLEEKK